VAGRTFRWKGKYGFDLNAAQTLDTQLNVFEHFSPRLGPEARKAERIFLGNIDPELQLRVLEQAENPRLVCADTMNFWIDSARDALERTIRSVDCLILNDEELEQLTGAPTTPAAAEELLSWGLKAVVAKQGKYGAALFSQDGFFALPAYPLAAVIDPTGAGDSFAGGFVGYVAAQRDEAIDHDLLSRAMAYGTALASFNVEEFGTERVARLTAEEVADRVADLRRMTRFELAPLTLRG